MIEEIEKESKEIIEEFFEEVSKKTEIRKGSILVVGCSTSEVLGGRIGKESSLDVAESIYNGFKNELDRRDIYLASQCCEHLNRALVIEREVAEKFGLEIVSAVPQMHAGGSFPVTVYKNMKEPVLVEDLFVFITPKIIRSFEESETLTAQKQLILHQTSIGKDGLGLPIISKPKLLPPLMVR